MHSAQQMLKLINVNILDALGIIIQLLKTWAHGSYYSADFIFPDFPGQNEWFPRLICSCEIPMSFFKRL